MKVLNRNFYYLFFAALLMSCLPDSNRTTSYGSNLLQNGGFEQSGAEGLPSGWRIIPHHKGKGEAVVDETFAHSGRYSLKLKPNKRNTSEGFAVFVMLDKDALEGREITISGFVKTEGAAKSAAAILLSTDKKNWLMLPKDTKETFVPFTKTFPISRSIPQAGLLLFVGGTKGAVWFDELTVNVVEDTPAPSDTAATLPASTGEYINKINTPGWQDSVYISPDGKELYFAYMPYLQFDAVDLYFKRISEKDVKQKGPIRPGSHNGKLKFETYKAIRQKDGTWGRPINLNINSSDYSLYAAKLSYDGKELYYAIREYDRNYGADDIYVSKKLPNGKWGPPENLGPNINTHYREDTPCLNSDGKTLYFCRSKSEIVGWEIMVSKRIDGRWTKATKLGPPINQPRLGIKSDYQPFITADGKELYFTRIQDLYKSQRQPDGGWGKPVKVFPKLLGSGHASVTDDGRYLYFLTTKDKESFKRHHWTISYSERQKDGSWGEPKPVD